MGGTRVNIVLLRPLKPRAQEAPVERGQLPAFSKCTFMHFIGVGPVPGTDTSKVPKRGLKCRAECAKGSNQDEPPAKVAFTGSQSLQLNEDQSFCRCANFTQLRSKGKASVTANGRFVFFLLSWVGLLVYKGCRCCCCKGSLRPTMLG